jgi:hypothetical protein
MALPSVSINFTDGGLGVIASGAGKTQLNVGISLLGDVNTILVGASPSIIKRQAVGGKLCDSSHGKASRSGSTVLMVNVPINSAGTVSALTQSGTGAGAPTGSAKPIYQILAKCMTGGTLGTAAFQFSVNGGVYGATVTSTATSFPYRVPGTYTTLTFAAATYRLNDVHTVTTAGVITVTAGGPDTVTQVSSPLDDYRLLVTITKAGARGTAEFTYSLDNGSNTSRVYATAASFVVPGAGIVLAFSDAAYVEGDTFTGTSTGPAFSSSDAQAAIEVALKSAYQFEGIHVVGTPATASAALTLATMLDTEVQAAETTYLRFIWGVSECPTAEADATVMAAFASLLSNNGRLEVAIGDGDVLSTDTGLVMKRNAAWPYVYRLAGTKYSTHPGFVESGKGALKGVRAIYNAYGGGPAADTFDGSRFVTMRTFPGKAGYYITNGNTMATSTSDYAEVQFVRVINRAATIIQDALTDYVNGDWRLDPDTGHIDDRDAGLVESKLVNMIKAAMMGEPGAANDDISGVNLSLDRSANLLSTATLPVTIGIIPKGYSKFITANLGFVNPMLAA